MSEHTIRAQTEHPEEAILAFSKELGEYVDSMISGGGSSTSGFPPFWTPRWRMR